MKSLTSLFLVFVVMAFFSCGNDPAVESSYVQAIERCIRHLDHTRDTEGLVVANDMLDSAKSLPGVADLSHTGAVKEVEVRLASALDSAQNRVMDLLRENLADTTDTVGI